MPGSHLESFVFLANENAQKISVHSLLYKFGPRQRHKSLRSWSGRKVGKLGRIVCQDDRRGGTSVYVQCTFEVIGLRLKFGVSNSARLRFWPQPRLLCSTQGQRVQHGRPFSLVVAFMERINVTEPRLLGTSVYIYKRPLHIKNVLLFFYFGNIILLEPKRHRALWFLSTTRASKFSTLLVKALGFLHHEI